MSIYEGRKASEIAVLYRMNAQAGLVELEMIRRRVAYRVEGRGFFMRPEVDAAVKYIALAVDEADEDALGTVYKVPTRWIRRDFLSEFPTLASLRGKQRGLVSARWRGAGRLLRDMDALIKKLKENGLVDALAYAFDVIGIRKHCVRMASDNEDAGEDADDRADGIDAAIKELVEIARVAGSPAAFLELVRDGREGARSDEKKDGGPRDDRVTLSTIHRFKGLERDEVFVIGVSPGLFPSKNAPQDEERRLAYVAFTRPRHALRVSWARSPSTIVYEAGLAARPIRMSGSLDDMVELGMR
jgi:DNA helicase-2/ATP-dependent DNA helicase PcrA